MTLEESIKINNITAEIMAKKGKNQISTESLERILNLILKRKKLDTINSEMIDMALSSVRELEPKELLIEKFLYVMTFDKSKEYKNIKEYVADFEDLNTALTSTFFDGEFVLDEKMIETNPVLYYLTVEYRKAKDIMLDKVSSLTFSLLLDEILDQIFILFFLHPSDYEYKYELLSQTINILIDNEAALLKGINLNTIEMLQEKSIEERKARKIVFLKQLLDQQYREPIKSTKKA